MAPIKKKVGRPKKDIVEEVRKEVEEEMKGTPVVGPQEDTSAPLMRFFNATNLKFIDIDHEEFRQYLYPNGAKIEIKFPLKLSIDRNNIHRVFDFTGLSYYIPPNWIAVVTKPKPGGPDVIM